MIKPIHCFAAIFCLTMTGAALAELSIPVFSTAKLGGAGVRMECGIIPVTTARQ